MEEEKRQLLVKQKELEDKLAAETKKAEEQYKEKRLEIAELREKLRKEEADREDRKT